MEGLKKFLNEVQTISKLPEVLSLKSFMAKERPESKYIIKGLLPERGKLLFTATAKLGKSLWAIETGLCIASGHCNWLGWQFNKPSKVLYVQGEIMDELLEDRLKWILKSSSDDISLERAQENFFIQEISESRPNLLLPKGQRDLEHLLSKNNPDVLILDPLSALCPGFNENETPDATKFCEYLTTLTIKYNVAIINNK